MNHTKGSGRICSVEITNTVQNPEIEIDQLIEVEGKGPILWFIENNTDGVIEVDVRRWESLDGTANDPTEKPTRNDSGEIGNTAPRNKGFLHRIIKSNPDKETYKYTFVVKNTNGDVKAEEDPWVFVY